MTPQQSDGVAGSLSNQEVGQCIRDTSSIFHILHPPVGPVHPEILSEYDKTTGEAAPEGFCLCPNSIVDIERRIAFNTHVYQEWIRKCLPIDKSTAMPGISFVEATGSFYIEAPEPGTLTIDSLTDKAGLQCILESLINVALNEAVKLHLTEGGDERLHIQPTTGRRHVESGGNKYYCPPYPAPQSTIVRGSCTCSPPSRLGFEAAKKCLHALWNGAMSAEDAFGDVRRRISKTLGIKTPHHIVLHPSGTDAEFTALLAGLNQARYLGCSRVVNIVVGAREVGSNTAMAAGGKHFSKHLPVSPIGGCEEETARSSDTVPPPAVSGRDLEDGISVVELAARSDDGSMVPDFDAIVVQALADASLSSQSDGNSRPFFIVHVVDGSKLGSHITSRSLVERILRQYGGHVLFVLDACQARTSTEELDWYLSRNAVVLVTASKFYGAPGFCAAALVPDYTAMAGLFVGTNSTAASGRPAMAAHNLGRYITRLEVPPELGALRESLPAGPANVGLLLRWSCGVSEMERFARAGQRGREVISQWVDGVRTVVRSKRPHFQLLREAGREKDDTVPFPAAETFVAGVNSIVSFAVLMEEAREREDGPAAEPCPLPAADLRQFHRWLTMDLSGMLPEEATDNERRTAKLRCFIGQPVDLGGFGVLRFAMGASLASDLAEGSRHLDEVLADDGKVLNKILLAKKYQSVLCARDLGRR